MKGRHFVGILISLVLASKYCEKRNIGANKAMEYLCTQGIDYWKKYPGAGTPLNGKTASLFRSRHDI
jgi:hypothetical protein